MKQQVIALVTALALALSLGVSVLAASTPAIRAAAPAPQEESAAAETQEPAAPEGTAETAAEAPAEDAGDTADTGEEPTLAGPDDGAQSIVPDPVGSISFANVERRIRENNLTILGLEENVAILQDIDYEKLEKDLRDGLNSIATAQWSMIQGASVGMIDSVAASLSKTSMQQQYDALRTQFDDLKDGKLQSDNETLIRQLQNGEDQLVLAGEATFIALAAMESQETSLQRQLAALNRTVEELELRYRLGQISALQLQEAKAGRTALVSGLETLRMNIRTYKTQLENMLGAGLTGTIHLGAVPAVTEKQIADMDLERDLAAAKEKSYELRAAKATLDDAQETYKDDADTYNYNDKKEGFRRAQHTWQAAQYTYTSAVQSYELKFRTLYDQVHDYRQIWQAARVALASEQASYQASELKYQQGTISKNALLAAEDDLRAAEAKVTTAANDLFSAYNTYCWAVEHGILN